MALLEPLLYLTLSASFVALGDTTLAAKEVVRQALHAVEVDSVASLRRRWSAMLQQDSGDRAALLGLATLARLAYDYPTSDRLYPRLFGPDTLQPDPYAAHAHLGRAWSFEERGQSDAAGKEFARARLVAHAAREPAAEAEALIGLSFAHGATEGVSVVMARLDTAATLIPRSALDLQVEWGWRRAVVLGILADSNATAEAVASVDFYQALAHGLAVGDALRTAKLDALRRGAPAKEWAAFTIVGDPLARVPLRSPAPWQSAVLVATLALGVAGGIAYSRR